MNLRIGTWNVLSLFRTGAVKQLQIQMNKYKLDVLALQEVRWRNGGISDVGNFTIFNSASTKKNTHGTGFIVRKNLRNSVIDFSEVNERISILRLSAKFFNISVVCVHAPTEDAVDEQKDIFYDKLQSALDKIPKHDVKIVIGDFNAKIGKENSFIPTIGKFSLHELCNDNGIRAVDFAASNNLKISSTCFKHKNIHKETWISPDGKTKNQIDHIMIDFRHASDVMDVRSYRGADIDSDHHLVIMKYRQRISRFRDLKGVKQLKFKVKNLLDAQCRNSYQRKLHEGMSGEYVEFNEEDAINNKWEKCKSIILKAAEEIVGREDRHATKDWFDEECRQLIEEKNLARQKMLKCATRQNENLYKAISRKTHRVLRCKKRALERNKIQEVEHLSKVGDISLMYSKLKSIKKGYQPRTLFCKDKNNLLIGGQPKVLDRWAEYFEELLNRHAGEINVTHPENVQYQANEETCVPPSVMEIREAIVKLKNGRAPGEDLISSELLKYGGESLVQMLHDLISDVWQDERMPKDWNSAIIFPIHKKGSILNCQNFRGITLLNATYKVLARIIARRLQQYADTLIGDYQCGFRRGRSTVDQIFSIRNILEKFYEQNINVHQLFIDFKQAYDSINRMKLYDILMEFNIPIKLINLVKMTLENTIAKIKVQGNLSREFKVKSGLKQGDSLSTILFNLCLEKIIRCIYHNRNGSIINRSIQILAFADDVDLLARNKEILIETYKKLEVESRKLGLEVNKEKTKYLKMDRKYTTAMASLAINNELEFQEVSEFKYLGSIITNDNNLEPEIKARLTAGNKCYYSLRNILKSTLISRTTKLKIYKAIIKPVVTYAGETWTTTQKEERQLITWERKILRQIFGPVKDGITWRIRTNIELEHLYNEKDIINTLKIKRLQWLGHLIRMEDGRSTKKIYNGKLLGTRKVGRPRKRWKDEVEKDLSQNKIMNYKLKANDRKVWRGILREAKILHGL